MRQQSLAGTRSDAGDGGQFRREMTFGPPEAMKGDGEAMAFAANLVGHFQNRGTTVEDDRLVFPSRNVKNFLTFGDAGQGLIHDVQCVQSRLGRMELAD